MDCQGIPFILFFDWSLQVNISIIDLSCYSANCLTVDSLGFFYIPDHVTCEYSLTSSSPIWNPFIFFSCLIVQAI